MKLKDLEKYVNEIIKFDEFKGKKDRIEIKVSEKFADFKANSFKELYEEFNEEYFGEISKDTEVRYENDTMIITLKWQERTWNIEERKFEFIDKQQDWNLRVDIIETNEFGTIYNEYSI